MRGPEHDIPTTAPDGVHAPIDEPIPTAGDAAPTSGAASAATPAAPASEPQLTEPEPITPTPEDEDEDDPPGSDPVAEVSAQRDQYLALAQRTQADFENYRKRMSRDLASAEARGVTRLARELLPALDGLQRALDSRSAAAGAPIAGAPGADHPVSGEQEGLATGIGLVQAQLVAALARLGIEAYSPQGEAFDPVHHEAMAQQPVEGAQSGTVVEVYQAGYRLGDSVIRPARVVVAA